MKLHTGIQIALLATVLGVWLYQSSTTYWTQEKLSNEELSRGNTFLFKLHDPKLTGYMKFKMGGDYIFGISDKKGQSFLMINDALMDLTGTRADTYDNIDKACEGKINKYQKSFLLKVCEGARKTITAQ